VGNASGPASPILTEYGRRVGSLGPGLTSESADAVRAVLRDDLSAGSQVFTAPTSGAGLICPAWTRGLGFPGPTGQRVRAIPQPQKGMAVTIVEEARPITGGVDTHADTHVAAALDSIEGTGSYGAGLARHITAAGVRVVEAARSDRQDRRRQGKSDPLDAVSAARAAQSGRARGAPKGRDGAVEAIRALMVARRSAAGERTQTINQARALALTGPDDVRVRFAGHTAAALVAALASLRPRPGSTVGYATRIALRELGRRAQFLDTQLERLDELIIPLVTARAPGLLALYGIGPHTAALLLIAAGDHPQRLRSEAAWAHLCAAAPIPASSGKTVRHRLNPGGDRQANHALWRIVFTRLGSHPATRAYAERRTAEGKSKAEIIRCLKRYVAREVYPHLRTTAG